MTEPTSRQPGALRQARRRPSGLTIVAAIYAVALIDLFFAEYALTLFS